MSEQVKVDDLQVFRTFRAALLKFAQTAALSLTNAESNIARTRSWLENEQRTYWEGQLRKRMELVTQAREVVRQKKLYKDASGRTPGAIEEEKALAKCVAAVNHAQERLDSIRRWLPKLEKSAGLYRSGVNRLSKTIDDIPQAAFLLDRMAISLEAYVQIETAEGITAEAAFPSYEGSVSRGDGGDTPAQAAPTPAATPVASTETSPPADSATPSKEHPHVPHGQ